MGLLQNTSLASEEHLCLSPNSLLNAKVWPGWMVGSKLTHHTLAHNSLVCNLTLLSGFLQYHSTERIKTEWQSFFSSPTCCMYTLSYIATVKQDSVEPIFQH